MVVHGIVQSLFQTNAQKYFAVCYKTEEEGFVFIVQSISATYAGYVANRHAGTDLFYFQAEEGLVLVKTTSRFVQKDISTPCTKATQDVFKPFKFNSCLSTRH